MNNTCKNVAVVGFLGTGSSAVIDLLREYSSCRIALNYDERGKERPYEHKLLYAKGGIIETSLLLTNGNTAYGSDIAINSFINGMMRLYKNNFVSFGSYKRLLGIRFWESVQTYLHDIGATRLKSGLSRSEHKKSVYFSPIIGVLQIAARIVFRRPIYKFGKANIMDKNPYYFAMPTKDQAISAARMFIQRYFDMCYEPGCDVMVYDQLIHPQHTSLIDHLFDDSFRVIIVKRDPRDVYCLSKYVWSKPPHGFSAPLPEDYDEFASFWKAVNTFDQTSNKVLTISFEDLVYDYESTRDAIAIFLGLKEQDHINVKKYFDPDKSIKNTQVFLRDKEYLSDADRIGTRLKEFLYDFPYEVFFEKKDIFEDTNESSKKSR